MNEKVESFKNRLKYALEHHEMRAVDLCNITKISQSTMSQYLSGYAEPKKARLQLIAEALNVNPTWLMGLDVPMELPSINFDTTPDDCHWNRALSKLQTGETLTEEETEALHAGLPKAIDRYKEVFTSLEEEFYQIRLKATFSQLSNINKKKVIDYSDNLLKIQNMEDEQLRFMPQAAQRRNDIDMPDNIDTSDDDIMDDKNF